MELTPQSTPLLGHTISLLSKKLTSVPWFATMLSLAATASLIGRFRSPAFLNAYDDDAFYYFQIARNIANHHGSSFDGMHLTNGYHPLWMLVLVLLSLVSSGKVFFILLQCVALTAFMTTFLAARGAFRCLSKSVVATEIAASIVAFQCLVLIRGGMEVTLTIPLALLLCWYRLRPRFCWTLSTAVSYGFLGALVVLSRLDAIFFIAALSLLELVLASPRSRTFWLLRMSAAIAAGIPLLLYFLSNRLWFHVWMPISGLAKQLRLHHSFHLATIADPYRSMDFTHRTLIIYPAVFVLLLTLALLLGPGNQRLSRDTLIVALSLGFLPILQLISFWTLSDWPMWSWYLYSFPLAMTGAFLLIFNRFPSLLTRIRRSVFFLAQGWVVVLACIYAFACTSGSARSYGYVLGKNVEAFAQTHDGVYAMGDCAGTAGYLIRQPVIQLEGLVMDATFLDNIREQRNLNSVLETYGVRYYATADAKPVGSCYEATEPVQAGPDSPRMVGRFCQTPIATYSHGPGSRTLRIFDLQHPNVPAEINMSP